MEATNISTSRHFHKVVDCQWACPAHTPVPDYIRLIAEGRYSDAYMANWHANVFPGILGRTCDRPCEPACRRGRIEKEPVAICRLKRVAADNKDDVRPMMPRPAGQPNGKRIALVGAGPASLTAARDLALLGYRCVIFDQDPKAGGMMRTRIPRFRVTEEVLDEEIGYILDLGVEIRGNTRIDSLSALLAQGWDAVFIGAGAPRGLDLVIPGRAEAAANIHIGVEWLADIWFQHIDRVGKRVVVIGAGNTAMDCARSARRLGGEQVTIAARGSNAEMRSPAWEKEAMLREGAGILDHLVPKQFTHENGRLTGVAFEPVRSVYENGQRRLVPTGEALRHIPCDDVLLAIGEEPAFPWIERGIGIEFLRNGLPSLDPATFQSTHPKVFFGGDAAFGGKNIITAVAHGREAALSIDLLLRGADMARRPAAAMTLSALEIPRPPRHIPQVSALSRHAVPLRPTVVALADIRVEAELGFDIAQAVAEANRCLNCDAETVFAAPLCVECKACEAVCPTDCITFTQNGEEAELRHRLRAPAEDLGQDLYVATGLLSGRAMVKSEDICLHCGLCAENCPTGAWTMQRFQLQTACDGDPVPALASGASTHV